MDKSHILHATNNQVADSTLLQLSIISTKLVSGKKKPHTGQKVNRHHWEDLSSICGYQNVTHNQSKHCSETSVEEWKGGAV